MDGPSRHSKCLPSPLQLRKQSVKIRDMKRVESEEEIKSPVVSSCGAMTPIPVPPHWKWALKHTERSPINQWLKQAEGWAWK